MTTQNTLAHNLLGTSAPIHKGWRQRAIQQLAHSRHLKKNEKGGRKRGRGGRATHVIGAPRIK